jgi:hypothetical protein
MAPNSKVGGAPVQLYDKDGGLVGMWCSETGRAMLGDAFYVKERQPQDAIRLGTVRDNGYGTVSLDGTD